MPPIKSLSHLAPLDLPAQVAVYKLDENNKLAEPPRVGVQDDGSGSFLRANRKRIREWLSTNIRVQNNKRAVRCEESDKSVTVYFDDGTSATGDILVGADGAHSHGMPCSYMGFSPPPQDAIC
jgi:flavin-dependent dehydrogenase